MLAVVSRGRYQRARLIFEAAEGLAERPQHSRETQLLQLDLYRQAALWAVLAMAPAESTELWPSVVLFELGVAPKTAELLALQNGLDDERRDDAALKAALGEARSAVVRAFEVAEAPERRAARHERSRVVRRSMIVAGVLVMIASSWAAARGVLTDSDLAKGKPWRASSKFADCHPELLECGGTRTSIFFHTLEENNPWVEIDLGALTEFREVVVYNRSDAVQERAVPLVVEVGDDRNQWREVARRDDVFQVWKAKFPSTRARFVRLRVAKVTHFHLDAVKVYR